MRGWRELALGTEIPLTCRGWPSDAERTGDLPVLVLVV